MSGGKLLTPKEQISHLKEGGISFHLFSEEDALIFLQESSYLTKISAYRKNYQKHPAGPNKDKYIHLDFAYLIELSKLDMYLRRLTMQNTLKKMIFSWMPIGTVSTWCAVSLKNRC